MPVTTLNHPEWKRRCTARRAADGEQCGRWALRGALVCSSHGGRAPQVMAAAANRMEEYRLQVFDLVPKAVKALAEMLDSPEPGIRFKAAVRVLDQAGFVVVTKQEVDLHRDTGVRDLDEEVEALLFSSGALAPDNVS